MVSHSALLINNSICHEMELTKSPPATKGTYNGSINSCHTHTMRHHSSYGITRQALKACTLIGRSSHNNDLGSHDSSPHQSIRRIVPHVSLCVYVYLRYHNCLLVPTLFR